MERVVLPEIQRADLGRAAALHGTSNTWILKGDLAVAQRTRTGLREYKLERGQHAAALSGMSDREVRYDPRSGRYAVMIGGDLRFVDLAESVVIPARRIQRLASGVATLSGQSVVVGPIVKETPSFRRK